MTWQSTPYTPALVAAVAATAALAYLVWRRPANPGRGPMALLLLAASVWSLGYALELAAGDVASKLAWANFQYFGIVCVPPLWLLFSLAYTGRRGCVRPTCWVLLGAVPVMTVALAWLEGDLGLMRRSFHLDLSGGFALLAVDFGPWFWANAAYSYVLLGAGMLLLVPVVLRSPFLYRWQAGTVLLGLAAPWLGNACYIFGIGPFPHLDLTIFGFIPTGLTVAWGLFRYRLLDVVPVARDAVLDGMSDGVVVVGPHGLVADTNPAALAMLQRVPAMVIGRPVGEVLGELSDDLEGLADAETGVGEVTCSRDGRRRDFEIHVAGLRDRGGRAVGQLVTIHDIGDRKRAEEELVRTQRLLAAGELSLGISHNLNNLLTGILGPAELIARVTQEEADIQDQARLIVRAARRARDLVQRLSESAREAEGEDLEAVSVHGVMTDAVAVSRPRWKDEAEARGVRIELTTRMETVPAVAASANGLHDVLLNLIFNAVDALPEGGRVEIGCSATSEHVEVRVADNGVGMAETVRQRVFEPFFSTKAAVGAGLGLSTAYSTVTRWGGTLEVESAPGEGSTFSMRLPLWRGGESSGETAATELAPALAESERPTGLILVAEDEAIVQVMLAEVLNRAGHKVKLTADGEGALQALAGRGYDAAVVDLGMPGMAGDQVAAHIREVDAALATVLITGWSLSPDDPRLGDFDFCLQKPFDVAQVESVVSQALTLTARRRAVAD